MGNCLKSPTSDDISLLHESQSDRASYGDGADPDQEPPPPYQVTLSTCIYTKTSPLCVVIIPTVSELRGPVCSISATMSRIFDVELLRDEHRVSADTTCISCLHILYTTFGPAH